MNKRGYCYEPWFDSEVCGADAYASTSHVLLPAYGITNSCKGGPTYLDTCSSCPNPFYRIYVSIKYISV